MHTNTRTYMLSSPCTYLAPSPPCSLNKQGSVDRVSNQNRCSNLPHKITHTYIIVDMHGHTDTHSHTHSYTLVHHHTISFNSERSQFHPRSVLIINRVSYRGGGALEFSPPSLNFPPPEILKMYSVFVHM